MVTQTRPTWERLSLDTWSLLAVADVSVRLRRAQKLIARAWAGPAKP
jgi:hypothetical protein